MSDELRRQELRWEVVPPEGIRRLWGYAGPVSKPQSEY